MTAVRKSAGRIGPLFLVAAFASCGLTPAALAHNGPPFPIITDKRVGPCVIALWTHPDVGTGSFWVMIDPPPGGTVPSDLKVQIAVQPVTGRLPEQTYDTQRDNQRGQIQFSNTAVEFDRQELWRVRVLLASSAGNGEATAQVEVTPPGLGRWDLLLYTLPFLLVAAMWYRGIRKGRAQQKRSQVQNA